MKMRLTEALGAVIFLAVTTAACAIALVSLCGCSAVEPESTWPESAEFSTVETGAERFSWHDTGRFGWQVVVDHETGVQYLACMEYRYGAAVCPLLDADGSPLLVSEAGE